MNLHVMTEESLKRRNPVEIIFESRRPESRVNFNYRIIVSVILPLPVTRSHSVGQYIIAPPFTHIYVTESKSTYNKVDNGRSRSSKVTVFGKLPIGDQYVSY